MILLLARTFAAHPCLDLPFNWLSHTVGLAAYIQMNEPYFNFRYRVADAAAGFL